MVNDSGQFDPLESAMLELRDAEGHGVFESTQVDAESLLGAKEDGHIFRLWTVRRWAAVAAAIVLAFGVWGTMFAVKIGEMQSKRPTAGIVDVTDNAGCVNCNFFGCFTGPAERIATKCLDHDYDADGDVDLADFREYQMHRRNG
jgi:hypothetical protein